MTFLERVSESFRGATKALSLRFGRGGSGWAVFSGKSRIDYAAFVGDGRGSSIVQAAVGWIARNFPEAPIGVQTQNADNEWDQAEDPGAKRLVALLKKPNPYWSGSLMEMAVVTDYWINGNAYRWKIRGGPGGAISEIWWVPASMIEPKGTESEYLTHYSYDLGQGVKIKIPPADIVHHRWGIDPDNIRKGLSPIGSVLQEIFTDEEAANFTASVLRNMGIPGLVVIPGDNTEVDDDDAEAVKKKLDQRFGGDNRGSTAVLSSKVEVKVLSWTPQQLQLRDLRRIPEERITAVIGIPAIVAGMGAGLDRSTYSNMGEARQAAYEENIIPTQRLFRDDLDAQLLPDFVGIPENFRTMHDLSEVRVLQEDQNAIATRAAAMLNSGGATVADFRRLVGLPVEDHHNYFLRAFSVSEIPDIQPVQDSVEPLTLSLTREQTEALGALIRSGFDPAAALTALGLDPIRHLGLLPVTLQKPPEESLPQQAPPETPANGPGEPLPEGKGSLLGSGYKEVARGPGRIIAPRQRIIEKGARLIEDDLVDLFSDLAKSISYHPKKDEGLDVGINWEEEVEGPLGKILRRGYAAIGEPTWAVVNDQLGVADAVTWDLNSRGVRSIMDRVATRVTMATESSKDSIRSVIQTGISIDSNADTIEKELKELLGSWGEDGGRAHIIALTESANAFNVAATEGYAESGLVTEVEVFDGDECGWTEHDDPDLADGSTRPLTEADLYPISHPHCQRAFGPVIEGSKSHSGNGRIRSAVPVGGGVE